MWGRGFAPASVFGGQCWQVKTNSQTMPEDNDHDQEAYYEAARALNERAFQAKERMRKRLAALSFTEKIKILEKLRDRELVIAEAWRKLMESKSAPDKVT
jgi:hypothetical protein